MFRLPSKSFDWIFYNFYLLFNCPYKLTCNSYWSARLYFLTNPQSSLLFKIGLKINIFLNLYNFKNGFSDKYNFSWNTFFFFLKSFYFTKYLSSEYFNTSNFLQCRLNSYEILHKISFFLWCVLRDDFFMLKFYYTFK